MKNDPWVEGDDLGYPACVLFVARQSCWASFSSGDLARIFGIPDGCAGITLRVWSLAYLTLTWAFSGLLSMEPWAWTERDQIEKGIRQAFASSP